MNPPFVIPSLADAAVLPARPVHLAIGIFDGVHLGHQAVIESALHSARREGGLVGVLTFHPHPSRLFRPDHAVRLLMPLEMKTWWLRTQLGVDFVIAEPFTREFAALTADEFLPHLRRRIPRLAAVYVGDNWRFGAGRSGDVGALVQSGRRAGVSVFSAPRIKLDGEPISSTRIRTHLAAGEITATNALLGYAYFARGAVAPGRRLGSTLGFPTLNVAWEPECLPAFGVYAVRVRAAGAPATEPGRPAVANYGVRPTVGDGAAPRLEVHLLEAGSPWDEGAELHVEWLEFLRPEARFGSLEELRQRIAFDVERARGFFGPADGGNG